MAHLEVDYSKAVDLLAERCSPVTRLARVDFDSALGLVLAEPVISSEGPAVAAGMRVESSVLVVAAEAGLSKLTVHPRPQIKVNTEGAGAGVVNALRGWIKATGGVVGEDDDEAPSLEIDFCAGKGEPIYGAVGMAPGGNCQAWMGDNGIPAISLPNETWPAFVAFHVLVAQVFPKLTGAKATLGQGVAPLRFAKAFNEKGNRWYPGRLGGGPGELVVEHLATEHASFGLMNALFMIPSGQWLRDGDLVTWVKAS